MQIDSYPTIPDLGFQQASRRAKLRRYRLLRLGQDICGESVRPLLLLSYQNAGFAGSGDRVYIYNNGHPPEGEPLSFAPPGTLP